jgi:hypothetical protein
MIGTRMQHPGSLEPGPKSQDMATKFETLREILRPISGLRMTVLTVSDSSEHSGILT